MTRLRKEIRKEMDLKKPMQRRTLIWRPMKWLQSSRRRREIGMTVKNLEVN